MSSSPCHDTCIIVCSFEPVCSLKRTICIYAWCLFFFNYFENAVAWNCNILLQSIHLCLVTVLPAKQCLHWSVSYQMVSRKWTATVNVWYVTWKQVDCLFNCLFLQSKIITSHSQASDLSFKLPVNLKAYKYLSLST